MVGAPAPRRQKIRVICGGGAGVAALLLAAQRVVAVDGVVVVIDVRRLTCRCR